MDARRCDSPITLMRLLEYLLDDISEEDTDDLEQHLFACDDCGSRLQEVMAMADGVRHIVSSGAVDAALTGALVERLRAAGVRVREYRLDPNTEVHCTITPEDDLIAARLSAPLAGLTRVDVLVHNPGVETPLRIEDVPFNPSTGEIVLMPQSAELRSRGNSVQQLQLVAVEDTGERTLGTYTFRHSPGDH